MKNIMTLLLIIIFIQCKNKSSKVEFMNSEFSLLYKTHQDQGLNYISFNYSVFDDRKFKIIATDSVYFIEVNGLLDTLLSFNNKKFYGLSPDLSSPDSLKLIKKEINLLHLQQCDSIQDLKFFKISNFWNTKDFGKLDMVLITKYREGIIGTYFELENDSKEVWGTKKLRTKTHGFNPDCVATDTMMRIVNLQ